MDPSPPFCFQRRVTYLVVGEAVPLLGGRGVEYLRLGAELGRVDAVFPQHLGLLPVLQVVTAVVKLVVSIVVIVAVDGDHRHASVLVVRFIDVFTTCFRIETKL